MEKKIGFEKVISFTPVKFTDELPPMDGRIVMFHGCEDDVPFWVPFLFEDGLWTDWWGGGEGYDAEFDYISEQGGPSGFTLDQLGRVFTHWAVIPTPEVE